MNKKSRHKHKQKIVSDFLEGGLSLSTGRKRGQIKEGMMVSLIKRDGSQIKSKINVY